MTMEMGGQENDYYREGNIAYPTCTADIPMDHGYQSWPECHGAITFFQARVGRGGETVRCHSSSTL